MELTGRSQQLLHALESHRDWMSRAQLARSTGKRVLSPHDKELLERLVNAGLVEKRQRESNTPIGIAFEYRVVNWEGER